MTNGKCVFCDIVSEKEPATYIHREKEFLVFENNLHWFPTQLLLVPTVHMTQNELWDNEYLIMKISKYANNLGKKRCPNGYRILSNFGTDAMQTQSHAHVHVIGGVNLGLYMNGSPPIKTQKYN
jgi:histidine triad (HIT) family protein